MEDRYQKIMDEENERLNKRIAKIELQHKRVRRNLYSVAVIIIVLTAYVYYIVE